MNLTNKTKPISYLKANAAKISEELKESHEPLVITQNGEAVMVVQSVEDYERTQESLALLKILTLGKKDIENGNTMKAKDAFSQLRKRRGLK